MHDDQNKNSPTVVNWTHEENMRIVGWRRGFDTSSQAANAWLKSINKLRGNYGICPRGVYKFETFEEADQWMFQMLVQSSLAARRSRT